MPAVGIGMTIDADIVGRIEKGRVDLRILADDGLKEVGIPSVTTADAMLARYIRDGELFVDNAAGALL